MGGFFPTVTSLNLCLRYGTALLFSTRGSGFVTCAYSDFTSSAVSWKVGKLHDPRWTFCNHLGILNICQWYIIKYNIYIYTCIYIFTYTYIYSCKYIYIYSRNISYLIQGFLITDSSWWIFWWVDLANLVFRVLEISHVSFNGQLGSPKRTAQNKQMML